MLEKMRTRSPGRQRGALSGAPADREALPQSENIRAHLDVEMRRERAERCTSLLFAVASWPGSP